MIADNVRSGCDANLEDTSTKRQEHQCYGRSNYWEVTKWRSWWDSDPRPADFLTRTSLQVSRSDQAELHDLEQELSDERN